MKEKLNKLREELVRIDADHPVAFIDEIIAMGEGEELVEKVAIKIHQEETGDKNCWEDCFDYTKTAYKELAKAAIAAIWGGKENG